MIIKNSVQTASVICYNVGKFQPRDLVMGTNAVFAVASPNEGKHYTKILGMTVDGFPDNLKYVAGLFCKKTRELGLEKKVMRNDAQAVFRVFDAMVEHEDGWLFVDDQKNADWVSYSAILNPKKKTLEVFEDMFEETLSFHKNVNVRTVRRV
jgi:hypothetical protein